MYSRTVRPFPTPWQATEASSSALLLAGFTGIQTRAQCVASRIFTRFACLFNRATFPTPPQATEASSSALLLAGFTGIQAGAAAPAGYAATTAAKPQWEVGAKAAISLKKKPQPAAEAPKPKAWTLDTAGPLALGIFLFVGLRASLCIAAAQMFFLQCVFVDMLVDRFLPKKNSRPPRRLSVRHGRQALQV